MDCTSDWHFGVPGLKNILQAKGRSRLSRLPWAGPELQAAAAGLLALLGIVQLNAPYTFRGLDMAIIGIAFLVVFYALMEHEKKLAKAAKKR